MEKVCTTLWRGGDADAAAVGTWAREHLLPHLQGSSAVRGATVHVETTDATLAPFRIGARPDGQVLAGLVSVWLDSYHTAGDVQGVLQGAPVSSTATYLVCESVPQPYGDVMTWPEGAPSPGLAIVTLLDKPEGVAEEVFYHYWHELHRVTTAECHPFTSYVRNEVVRPLSADAPRHRGIVTEASPDLQDFLDPHRFYVSGGDKEQLRANRRRVADETAAFIDFGTLQVAPMVEHVVRRLAPTSP